MGASGLIAERKIKLKQGKEIVKLSSSGVLFEDGVELPADLVVMATGMSPLRLYAPIDPLADAAMNLLGYTSIRDTVKRVISSDVAARLGTCWGQDQQGEIPSVWRHSGVPRFWMQVGNMYV